MAKRRKPRLKPAWKGSLPPLTRSIAEKLLKLGTIHDTEIARRMRDIGHPISGVSVRKIRTNLGRPAVPRRKTSPAVSPAVIERVKQLISARILNDSQVVAMVKAEFGSAIPVKLVSDSRHEMQLPVVRMGMSRATAKSMQRVQTLRDQYARMPQKDVVEEWSRLTTTQSELKARCRAPGIDKKKLFEQIAQIEEQREALFALLPKEIRKSETEIVLERTVPVSLALAKTVVEISAEKRKRKRGK